MKSDYLKLSELYASFLVAVGGVSITVLALVLSFGRSPDEPKSESETREQKVRAFLVAALVVATVSCFVGAQMMAETAAFIQHHDILRKAASPPTNYPDWSGERLFLLASANIFIAVALLLFALVLLLNTSGKVDEDIIRPLAVSVFLLVLGGAIVWVVYASLYRMHAPGGWHYGLLPAVPGAAWGVVIYRTQRLDEHLLSSSLIPVVVFTVFLLLYFVGTCDAGGPVSNRDIALFSAAVSFSYSCLIFAGLRVLFRPDLPAKKVKAEATPAEGVGGNVTAAEKATGPDTTQNAVGEKKS